MAQYLVGGEQTTINSTITELFPALAFNGSKKPFTADSMYEFIDNLWHKDMLDKSPYSKTFAAIGDRGSAYEFIEDIEGPIGIVNCTIDKNCDLLDFCNIKSPINKINDIGIINKASRALILLIFSNIKINTK